ncbi:hypothetical protein AXK57_21430 [Tsukamurella pulmonis]|uniref:hypothetical protein n=1 Tax=Tsukamurella pulmonis TaxID=47312 RepID=UPI000799D850|nr:hypothetical protein [Tsukamurella pulmonis]KXP11811.1 hypothetical protein AXK57_21430 [Tsukamurella pulmonis]RDH13318.1 hypothetical protein DVB88_03035 [Tsukamurella pulmonis]
MGWDPIDEFIECLARWRRVQEHVQNLHIQRPPDAELITFETPIIDGDVLVLPNGPLRESDSEFVEHLSVSRDGDHFTLNHQRRDRGEYYEGPVKLFSNFTLAGKFILTRYAAEFRTLLDLPMVLKPWIGAEPRTGWSTREVPPTRENAGGDH